ncbi:MAG TPA: type II toxin-antitoxin system VapC family toxin [Alphaproteobacteria bacterium]|nr:type II toxin-antitoxin system VapC family toxin [Alphaproteobacteria bacterium]
MTRLVIDASVAVKWVVTEPGTKEAVQLLEASSLAAPDLLVAECANVLWKKVQRKELNPDEALLAARLLERADIEIYPTRHLLETAARIAIDLNHPAYDCIYLGLAMANGWQFVTADNRLLNKLRQARSPTYGQAALSISDAIAETGAS